MGRGCVCPRAFGTSYTTSRDSGVLDQRRKSSLSRAFFEMELAGLEPATSWVRYRAREPNRGDLSSLGCSKFS